MGHKHPALERSLWKWPRKGNLSHKAAWQEQCRKSVGENYLLEEIGQRGGMVQVKAGILQRLLGMQRAQGWVGNASERRDYWLGDEEDVYGGWIDLVEVGQRRHAGVGRVDAAVELAAHRNKIKAPNSSSELKSRYGFAAMGGG